MDFEFSPEQTAFVKEVEQLPRRPRRPRGLRRHPGEHGPDRRHPRAPRLHGRDGRAGLAGDDLARPSTGARRARASTSTCSTSSWPGRGGPQIGKGVGIVGKTIIRHGSEKMKAGVPPQDPAQRGGVRRRLLRAQRRLRRRVHAAEGDQGGRRLGAQRPEDLDHLGPLRRVVLGRGPHRPRGAQARRHHPVPGAHRPAGHHRQRHLDHGRRADQRGLPGRRVRPRRLRGGRAQPGVPVHLRGARPRAVHDVHLLAHRPATRAAHRVRQDARSRDGGRCGTTRSSASASPSWPPRPRWPG